MSAKAGTPSALAGKVFASRPASIEPSPASSYGDSAASDAGDDVPGTPDDEGVSLTLAGLSVEDKSARVVERYSPPFVRHGRHGDDPFMSPSSHRHSTSAHLTPTGRKHTGRAVKSGNWRSGSSSGSGSRHSSPAANAAIRSAHRGQGVFVREFTAENLDMRARVAVDIKSEDAQGMFPPSSCVFVANLLQSESDESLEVAVTQVFREYGTVFVKIRRDPKHMPFAFCQFTKDEDAERAIIEGRGRLIKGRPCRCEKAKAHRLFFFERKYGSVVTPQEVEQLVRGYGCVTFCRPVNAIERASYNLSEGVMVQFELYDEGQAALQAFRNNDEYKMQSMANMGSAAYSQQNRGPSDPAARLYLDTYDVDRRSIFVGNLPVDITEHELKRMFEKYGSVRSVALHKNDSLVDSSQKHCFAFIEFVSVPSVTSALEDTIGFAVGGKSVRVSQKDTEAAKQRSRRSQLRASPAPIATYQSPARSVASQVPASPLPAVSPGYPATYGYAFGSPMYAYPGGSLFTDGQGQYYQTYSPVSPYYAYAGSPAPSAAPAVPASPTAQSFYGGYYPQYAAAPYWVNTSPNAQQAAGYYQQGFAAPVAAQEDRSATPTPAGHAPVVGSNMDSQ